MTIFVNKITTRWAKRQWVLQANWSVSNWMTGRLQTKCSVQNIPKTKSFMSGDGLYWSQKSSANVYCKQFGWFRICRPGDSNWSVRPKCSKNKIIRWRWLYGENGPGKLASCMIDWEIFGKMFSRDERTTVASISSPALYLSRFACCSIPWLGNFQRNVQSPAWRHLEASLQRPNVVSEIRFGCRPLWCKPSKRRHAQSVKNEVRLLVCSFCVYLFINCLAKRCTPTR